jgi:hypothetical protein
MPLNPRDKPPKRNLPNPPLLVPMRFLKKKKKQAIPLAASSARRTPQKRLAPETNTEEGSMSF